MADIAPITGQARPLDGGQRFTVNARAGVDLKAGQAAFIDTADGLAKLANGAAVATARATGIVMSSAPAGQPVTLMVTGKYAGYDFDEADTGSVVYVSASEAGELTDTAPSGEDEATFAVGVVGEFTDAPGTQYLVVQVSLAAAPTIANPS